MRNICLDKIDYIKTIQDISWYRINEEIIVGYVRLG